MAIILFGHMCDVLTGRWSRICLGSTWRVDLLLIRTFATTQSLHFTVIYNDYCTLFLLDPTPFFFFLSYDLLSLIQCCGEHKSHSKLYVMLSYMALSSEWESKKIYARVFFNFLTILYSLCIINLEILRFHVRFIREVLLRGK